ncbi:MAG: mechanosensitive ion channel domain-containing protein [Thermodesulfobacteriota bacterium]
MVEFLENWLVNQGLTPVAVEIAVKGVVVVSIVLAAVLAGWVARKVLIPLLEKAVRKSSNQWDDILIAHGFFRKLGTLVPVVVVILAADLFFPVEDQAAEVVRRVALALFMLGGARVLVSFLGAAMQVYDSHEISRDRSVRGYLDVLKIVVWVLAVIFTVAVLADKSPWGIMSVFGGLTAVLLLVFKDTILGFVASLQLSGNNMARVGDWIEMPKYGADGDVIDVSIHTVKVQNWDKTITTIPTYALVSSSFKNWRGMSESGGRRIKRAIHIDMSSIRFCDEDMLERFGRYELLKDYLQARQEEIESYNKLYNIDTTEDINGRRQTNIGLFRAYVIAFLKANPNIHHQMTFLVRHLQSTPQGLPLEIYVFSNDQVWANYEAIQADIFDHLLAAIPEFGLRVFQYPSGHDLSPPASADFMWP